ncbi:hypothetical protein J7E80_16685 [Arthrobacter sp. ISL-28]|nr:hypothetical protein [Arthrobacter sp. ISL-28]
MILDPSADGTPVLVVAETNSHRLVRLSVPAAALKVDEGAGQSRRVATAIAAGRHEVSVRFTAPAWQKLDDRWAIPPSSRSLPHRRIS